MKNARIASNVSSMLRRPAVWVAVAVALLLLAAIAWRWSMPSAPSAESPPSLPRMGAVGNDVLAVAAAVPSEAPSGAEAPAPVAPSGTELVEVCGFGWVAASATGGSDAATVAGSPDVVASQRSLLAAIRSGGEYGSAVATVLELYGTAGERGSESPATAMLCTAAECNANDAARERGTALVEQLARQATTTSDPRVYALAFRECDRVQRRGSCVLLSAEQWARLDDGNGAPWLAVLSEAQRRGDGAEVDEALHRIGAATRWNERRFAAAAAVAEHAGPSDVDLLAAELLTIDAALRGGSWSPTYRALTNACAADSITDGNRRQSCDRAASTLADRSDSTTASLIGAAIGRRLGWPEERVDALRGLREAEVAMASASLQSDVANGEVPLTCDGARRILGFWSKRGRLGEVQSVRDWFAATGQTIAPYAAKAHALRAAAAPNVAPAASAPAEAAPATAAAPPWAPPSPSMVAATAVASVASIRAIAASIAAASTPTSSMAVASDAAGTPASSTASAPTAPTLAAAPLAIPYSAAPPPTR